MLFCHFENCNFQTKIKNQLDFHLEKIHEIDCNLDKIKCEHGECNIVFRSKGKLLEHHDNNDKSCKDESIFLIKLIKEFKNKIGKLLSEKNINNNFILKSLYDKVKECYQTTSENLTDEKIFRFILENESFDQL